MPRDELRHPLRKRSTGERLWAKRPGPFAAAAMLLAALFLAGGIWLVRSPARPFAGEPVVMADIPAVAEITTGSISPAAQQPEPLAADAELPEDPPPQAPARAVKVIRGSTGDTEITVLGEDGAQPGAEGQPPPFSTATGQEAQIIIAPHRPLKPAPVEAVTEETEQGPLPQIAANGRKPFDVYSQVTPLAVSTSGRPKITLVLGGMGLNAKLTQKAIKELPGDVTFGFAPYGEELQPLVNRARERGHEVLLQLPMEPLGYPGSNPGPHTLLSDAEPDANIESLRWLMSRFAGYSGITNYMGARLLTAEAALKPVLREVKDRGLVYFEDATVTPTLSAQIGLSLHLPVQRAGLVIDAEPTAAAITAQLARLEQEALAHGSAIGAGSGLDITIETVAEWTKTLQEKGILLVPVSAAYKGRAS